MARGVTGPCWLWQGCKQKGYGYVRWEGRTRTVHRLVYEAICGPIPVGWQVDHLCYETACYNPMHLEAVTPKENIRRRRPYGSFPGSKPHLGGKLHNGLKTHCVRGHRFNAANTRMRTFQRWGKTYVSRDCRDCQTVRQRERRAPKTNRKRPASRPLLSEVG